MNPSCGKRQRGLACYVRLLGTFTSRSSTVLHALLVPAFLPVLLPALLAEDLVLANPPATDGVFFGKRS